MHKKAIQILTFFLIFICFEGFIHTTDGRGNITGVYILLLAGDKDEDEGENGNEEEVVRLDCKGVKNGSACLDNCGICREDPLDNCQQDCLGVWGGLASVDDCGVCDEDNSNNNSSCTQDCLGTWDGVATLDNCGVCDQDSFNNNTSCIQDCLGTWGGVASIDHCGICDEESSNDDTTCVQDCMGIWSGPANIDNCDVCNKDPEDNCQQDCLGEWGGLAIVDDCGVCDEDSSNNNTTCVQDCMGTWDGSAITDDCGVCDDNQANNNTTCTQDCNDEWGGNAQLDDCGVCDSDRTNNNTTCVQDCMGTWDGTAITDDCGVCDDDQMNNNSTCVQDCMGAWGGVAYLDGCDLCVDVSAGAFPCTEVIEIQSSSGRIWMDRNLGAMRAAISIDDSEAYGYLFQWGRLNDGHQSRVSSTTSNPSTMNVPGHNEFILNNEDWRLPQNANLWQGLSGVNNPCPPEYRLPTETELNIERQLWSENNAAGAFGSSLKLVTTGYRGPSGGAIDYEGERGFYWSSSVRFGGEINYSRALYINERSSDVGDYGRSKGFSIRCIKE